MAEDREKEDNKYAENDIVSRINKKTLQKQKEIDSHNHEWLLEKKKIEEQRKERNPYKRRECNPINIINYTMADSMPKVKEEVKEKIDIKVEEPKIEIPKELPLKEQFKNKIDNQKKIVENMKSSCSKLLKIYGNYL